MVGPKTKVKRVVVSGPLAPFVSTFESKLRNAGYTPLSAVNQKRLIGHLSRWLEADCRRTVKSGQSRTG